MTLYTSAIDDRKIEERKNALKTAFVYLIISCLCGLFGAVYETFSHGVYSIFMIYSFAFTLVGGTLPFFILGFRSFKVYPSAFARFAYHSGIAALTVGSIVRGILDIYGTTNYLTVWYWIVGGILSTLGLIIYILQLINQN